MKPVKKQIFYEKEGVDVFLLVSNRLWNPARSQVRFQVKFPVQDQVLLEVWRMIQDELVEA